MLTVILASFILAVPPVENSSPIPKDYRVFHNLPLPAAYRQNGLMALREVQSDTPKTVTPPKLPDPNAPVFIIDAGGKAAAVPNAAAAAEPLKLSIRKFIFLTINEAAYDGADGDYTLDGLENNPHITAFVVKAGQKYPGWKEGDSKAAEHEPPQSKNAVLWIGGESQANVTLTAWGVKKASPGDKGKPVKLAVLLLNVGGAPPDAPVIDSRSEFVKKLQAAFTADASNVADAGRMAGLYRLAATTTVYDAGLATGESVLKEMQAAVKNLGIAPGSMNRTARVIADHLNLSFANTAALDKPTRDKLKASFLDVATALEALK